MTSFTTAATHKDDVFMHSVLTFRHMLRRHFLLKMTHKISPLRLAIPHAENSRCTQMLHRNAIHRVINTSNTTVTKRIHLTEQHIFYYFNKDIFQLFYSL